MISQFSQRKQHPLVTSSLRATSPVIGTFCVMIAAACFGSIPLFSRMTFADGLTPASVTFMRYFPPALLLCFLLPPLMQDRTTAFRTFLVGIGIAIGTYGYAVGIRDLDVAIAAIIFFSFPIFVSLYKLILFRQWPMRSEVITLILITMALLLVAGPIDTDKVSINSVLTTFLGPAAYGAVLVTFSTQRQDLPALSLSAALCLGGLLGSIAILLVFDESLILPTSTNGWIGVFGLSIIATLAPNAFLAIGAGAAGPTRSAIGGTFELPVSLSLGWFVLMEPIELNQIAGASIILGSLIVNILKR
jgi:drug/metabolite transporter (DMT)-like permease